MNQHHAIVAELYERKCWCGRVKAAGVTFCVKCNQKLPGELHKGLLAGGGAYLVAYQACRQFFQELKAKAPARRRGRAAQ